VYNAEINQFFEDHREEFLADLAQLVAVNSVKGEAKPGKPYGEGPAQALAQALRIAEKYGLYTENWENYLGIVQLAPGAARKLDILAHLDVVPAYAEHWTVTDPFVLKETDGRVYGRGVTDDKGPALAAIYALRAIKELKLPCREPVRVFLGCDEESGSSDLAYYFSRTQAADMTISPDAGWPVINLEKGILTGTLRAKAAAGDRLPRVVSVEGGQASNAIPGECEVRIRGLRRAVLEPALTRAAARTGARFECRENQPGGEQEDVSLCISGVPAHASMPEKGNNAVTAALALLADLPFPEEPLWKTLADFFPHGDFRGKALGMALDHPLTGPLSLCLDVIRYKEGELRAVFDSRLPIGFGPEQIKRLEERLENGGLAFTHRETMPHYVPEDSPFIQSLLLAYEEFKGKKGGCRTIGGLTYCHGIKNAVAFGMESESADNHIHGNDEFAEVSELLGGGKIYVSAILRLCGDVQKSRQEGTV